MDEEADYGFGDLMEVPEGYYPPTPPNKVEMFSMRSGKPITLHLVGSSPTEAHHVWNGSKMIADFFEEDPSHVRGRTILELGSASGLPCLVAAMLGARKVVMSDYPDPPIMKVMKQNIEACDETVEPRGQIMRTVEPIGFIWGENSKPLLDCLNSGPNAPSDSTGNERFDVLILADLLFRHNEHGSLLKTISETLAKSQDSVAYVFFTSYRPWKKELDERFFDLAREQKFEVEQIAERHLDKPLFDNDPGDLGIQKLVRGFAVRWPAEACE